MTDTRGLILQEFFGSDTPICRGRRPRRDDGNTSEDDDTATTSSKLGPKIFVMATEKINQHDVSSSSSSLGTSFSSSGTAALGHSSSSSSSSRLVACLLRTYETPKSHSGIEVANGTSSIKMWEAAEATSEVPVLWNSTHARRQ